MFKIIKKGSGNFWHNFNNGSKEVNLSDWEIVLDSVNQTVSLQMLNGANVPINSVFISDILIIDETDGSVEETFVSVEALRIRLVELNYTPYIVLNGFVPEAPIDGLTYGRKDAEWVEVSGGGSAGTLQEVTDNGNTTTNDITAGGFLSLGNANIPGINFNDAGDLDTSLGFLLADPSITTPRNWVLPDTSGTIALKENTIPITGTEVDKPITGDLELTSGVRVKWTNPVDDYRLSIISEEGSFGIILENLVTSKQTIWGIYTTYFGIGSNEIGFQGITANADFSANYVDLSYVQKIYIDTKLSDYALTSEIPPSITIDATPTDGSSNAVSSNGVFDGLALKQDFATATTGAVISFSVPQVYNSVASPSSSNITDSLGTAKIGIVQKIYSNKATEPTYPAGWVKLSGTYTNSVTNIIYCEWCEGSRVEYWIVKA